MGVTGLWQVLQPCARPIKIETLNRKRLAVDASIWIYQFLKAVRDKEGNALRNSHVVGFFRRICKLLFIGIKPVFVFDGGAPALKRQTIRSRKARREGRREDAVRTAGKLLAVQMQRRAEEEEAQRRAGRDGGAEQEEVIPTEKMVYVDELYMSPQERQQKKFRKKDQYHLPELGMSLSEMGGANDPRVMSLEELQSYARQFETGEDINVYDFSKIDYESPFFVSLPASDRYNILNAARLRSRLRMGHSKEQLDNMFPDRMAFSKFQIERVRERNELTQRLMHLNGFEGAEFGGGRVAGEKGREYVLVRNDGVEGGWALGVIGDEGGEEKPIDVDRPAPSIDDNAEEEWEDDDGFEDVPIEGLNRLPKQRTQNEQVADDLLKQRRAVYDSRRRSMRRKPKRKPEHNPDSLFVQSSEDDDDEDDGSEEVDPGQITTGRDAVQDSEDEELRKAIAMSLEKETTGNSGLQTREDSDAEDDDMLELFDQRAVEEQRPLPKGSGRAIANIVNKRAFNTAPESREITSFGVPTQIPDDSDEDDTIDLQAALAQSRRTKRKTSPPRRRLPPPKPVNTAAELAKQAGFKGPLPFEKLDLGSSLLGKKKMQERTEEAAGGFENPELAPKEQKKAEPLPPWFTGDLEKGLRAQKAIEDEDRQKAREFSEQFLFAERGGSSLHRAVTNEVIDLDAEDVDKDFRHGEVYNLEAEATPNDNALTPPAIDNDVPSFDTADEHYAEPSAATLPNTVGKEGSSSEQIGPPKYSVVKELSIQPEGPPPEIKHASPIEEQEQTLEWSESDGEADARAAIPGEDQAEEKALSPIARISSPERASSQPSSIQREASKDRLQRSPSPGDEDEEFEDVEIPDAQPVPQRPAHDPEPGKMSPQAPDSVEHEAIEEEDEEDFDDFSDPDEVEMLRGLTMEAEEHARFASTLNNKSTSENIQEYERELKQLRNQQKKDRRDADEVTQIMIQECQALLRLFGLPYLTAPMEAEAQCAELVRLGLVDGIVTDDSDCFLFGGTRVYKNMFNQAKFVECYLSSDLEKEFDLTRDKLIHIAHLLGSDYTEGLTGIGPVTALEIISEFQNLEDFKVWWTAVQMNQIPKSEDAKNPFRKKFRKNATKLFLPASFPDARVDLAYQHPDVDATPEHFQWGVPDLEALRSFLMSTIGWSQERTDEVLVPVIKDMNRRADEGTQANITAFFDGTVGVGAAGASHVGRGEAFAPRKKAGGSKRMGSALNKLAERAKSNRNGPATANLGHSENDNSQVVSAAKTTGKRKKAHKVPDVTQAEDPDENRDEDSDYSETKRRKSKR